MFLEQVVNGIFLGSMYALVAIAFTLIMGIFGMLNIAVGEVFMLGAFFGMSLIMAGVPFHFALPLAMIGSGVVSLVIERLSFRPLRHAPLLVPLLSTIGFSILLQNLANIVWGTERLEFPGVAALPDLKLGSMVIPSVQFLVLGSAVALILALDLFIQRTRVGRGMRAVAENLETSSILGVEPNGIILVTFFVSGLLAGASGVFFGLTFSLIAPTIGLEVGLKGIAAMVVGGLGNMRGGIIGGLLIGITETLSVAYISASYRDVFVYSLLFLALIIRPEGILGTVQQEKGRA
ncbi:MAG: branched-chain amino acid ABC transporter permease [Candidatus Tectomicrobia bacterium]|nr:branched-chain amino acid ABC transporter permease [Candidatus Tectomicrobia bacterium]